MNLRIKEIMKLKAVRQARLAEMLDISPGYLSLLMHNQRNPSPLMLTRIAEALEVEVPELFATADPTANALREPDATPIDMTRHDAERLCKSLGIKAKHPAFYDLNKAALAFGMVSGDRLAIDLNGSLENGDMVLATITDGSQEKAQTAIYRWFDPWLISPDPLAAPAKMDSSGNVAILGKVCGLSRAL
tara:strand:+ start:983 stop:1549 length:567 start_codon:yes stop_codon:yes gene_type:complete